MTEQDKELTRAASAYFGCAPTLLRLTTDARGAFWEGPEDGLFPASRDALAAVRHDGEWEEIRAAIAAAREERPARDDVAGHLESALLGVRHALEALALDMSPDGPRNVIDYVGDAAKDLAAARRTAEEWEQDERQRRA